MIEKWFTRGLVVFVFLATLWDELDCWLAENRHHRHCARQARDG